jgi:type IV pilus assembly protein PilE
MTHRRGFTLIELMIAVAIVAILAVIAVPSYTEYVRRGRVTEAVSALSGMRVKMEQYFQDNRTYSGACAAGTVAPAPSSPTFTYACTLVAGPPSQYVVTATGKPGTPVDGFQYKIDEANTRWTVMAAPSTWPSKPDCWVLRKDGSC